MDLIRVGDKLISKDRIMRTIEKILELRNEGLSQAEAANVIGIDRSFVSRIESLGEIRKGSKIGLIGFPVANKDELVRLCEAKALDKVWIMNDKDRWDYIDKQTGLSLLGDFTSIIAEWGMLDYVIFIGSNLRIKMMESVLGSKGIGVEIGKSPIKNEVMVDISYISSLIDGIRK